MIAVFVTFDSPDLDDVVVRKVAAEAKEIEFAEVVDFVDNS